MDTGSILRAMGVKLTDPTTLPSFLLSSQIWLSKLKSELKVNSNQLKLKATILFNEKNLQNDENKLVLRSQIFHPLWL